MSFALVGVGSHGRDILSVAYRCDKNVYVLYDDDPDVGVQLPPDELSGHAIFGVNNSQTRREMAKRFPLATPAHPLIDPSAIIGSDCHIGRGSVVGPMASLLHSVTLGIHCHVNTGAQLVRTNVGSFCTISPGAVICGDVTIGEYCQIGAGAVISDRCTIGDNVVIGAGSVLPPLSEVPNGTTVIGVWHNAKSH